MRAKNQELSAHFIDRIRILLDSFLKHVNEFLPSNFLKMNVYLLSHLPLHLRKFGPAFVSIYTVVWGDLEQSQTFVYNFKFLKIISFFYSVCVVLIK